MLENECKGGESIIVDGWKVVEDLRKDNPEYFDILQKFKVPFRQFDQRNETYAEAPIIKCSADGAVESFRFSNQLILYTIMPLITLLQSHEEQSSFGFRGFFVHFCTRIY